MDVSKRSKCSGLSCIGYLQKAHRVITIVITMQGGARNG
jgi:hypothetical protein